MDLYSGAGLENFDSGDLKGVVVDVMSSIGSLREAYTQLTELFASLENPQDSEAVEVSLADDKRRETFYNRLCAFGRPLNLVLNAEQAYEALPKPELKRYQSAFAFFSKVRRSVKIRYCDAIDNREYEPLMQNLLDTHLSVAGLKQITSPIDILNKDDFERELESLGSARSKADAITSKLTKSISAKYQENPAYYDSFPSVSKPRWNNTKKKLLRKPSIWQRCAPSWKIIMPGKALLPTRSPSRTTYTPKLFTASCLLSSMKRRTQRFLLILLPKCPLQLPKSSQLTVRLTGPTTKPFMTVFPKISMTCSTTTRRSAV